MLREVGARAGFKVYSQWDGVPASQIVATWRQDETAVLVGTKSLLTRTDAPGPTCSLVILDRVPRAPSNLVDDDGAQLLQESWAISMWDADHYVYAQDAVLLVEQSAGRFIRSGTDPGRVAILDPRLLETGRFSNSAQTRATYMRALYSFTRKISDLDDAAVLLTDLTDLVAAIAADKATAA